MTLALAVLALVAAEWTRWGDRRAVRANAEALAAQLSHHAWSFDHWLHAEPQAAAFRPDAGTPQAARLLSAAELASLLDPRNHAAPWVADGLRLSGAAGATPAGADWHLRFAVGWPVSSTAGGAGWGAPYGVMVATAASNRAEDESVLVRNALIRRGRTVLAGAAAGTPPEDIARAIALAAGLAVGDDDIAVPAWSYSRIEDGLVLRMSRAGQPAPGMETALEFAPGGSILRAPAGTSSITADTAALSSLGGAALDIAAGDLAGGTARIGGDLLTAGDMAVAGTARAGSLEAVRWGNAGALDSTGTAAVVQFDSTGPVNAGRVRAESVSVIQGGSAVGEVQAGRIDVRRQAAIAEIQEVGNLFAAGGVVVGEVLHGSDANARRRSLGPGGICYGCEATAASTDCPGC